MDNIYIKIWKQVMAIIHKNQESKAATDIPNLTKDEIIWLLTLIKDGTFKGQDVQTVYETVVKLQLMLNKIN